MSKDSMRLLNLVFGMARKNPCVECGSPYHFTKDHKWFD